MEEKSRAQLLKELHRNFCQIRILDYNIIKDLLLQLQSITKSKGDEKKALLSIVHLAKKELKKYNKAGSQSDKTDILRSVLRNITNDLNNHIRNYFPD